MLARVQQDVSERRPYLARRSQQVKVVAPVENRSNAPEDAVHRTREPRTDRLHPACERVPGIRLDDEVCVIALERVMEHAKIAPLARAAEASVELAHQPDRAKIRNVAANAQRHVSGAGSAELGSFAMPHSSAK